MTIQDADGPLEDCDPQLLGHQRPYTPPTTGRPASYSDQTVVLHQPGLDFTKPNAARVYDYFLGGKDNHQVDRAVGDALLRIMPDLPQSAGMNRAFLGRACRTMRGMGITQFLDIGSGLPTRENTHQIVEADPETGCRVVYVDNDPLVIVHGRALLEDRSRGVAMVQGDLRKPDAIVKDITGLLDLSQPVGLLLAAVTHFLTDEEDPWAVVRALRDSLPLGSALAISHACGDAMSQDNLKAALRAYAPVATPLYPRSHADITRLFAGWDLVEPGLVEVSMWRPPVGPSDTRPSRSGAVFLGGLGVLGVLA